MTWKAELLKPFAKRDGNLFAPVQFTNGTESFTQEYIANNGTVDTFNVWCQKICEQREARDASFDELQSLEPGPITLPRDA